MKEHTRTHSLHACDRVSTADTHIFFFYISIDRCVCSHVHLSVWLSVHLFNYVCVGGGGGGGRGRKGGERQAGKHTQKMSKQQRDEYREGGRG